MSHTRALLGKAICFWFLFALLCIRKQRNPTITNNTREISSCHAGQKSTTWTLLVLLSKKHPESSRTRLSFRVLLLLLVSGSRTKSTVTAPSPSITQALFDLYPGMLAVTASIESKLNASSYNSMKLAQRFPSCYHFSVKIWGKVRHLLETCATLKCISIKPINFKIEEMEIS